MTYSLQLDRNSFSNIAWQIKKPSINVTIDANELKRIEVPVAVVGEVSGTVYFRENTEKKGLGRIIVNFYREDSSFVGRVLTEADGFFDFIGLMPGLYTARLDAAQLRKLRMAYSPAVLSFRISANKEGDIIDGLEFMLQSQ